MMTNAAYNSAFEAAKRFVYRAARPLELARWQYHFEGAERERVYGILAAYQNRDGGFGHALEPDFWLPASSPMAIWAATEIIHEVGLDSSGYAQKIIGGILSYLGSGENYDASHRQWFNCVPESNSFPHAVWWEYKDGANELKYNPTAALAGFIIRYADKDSALYKSGCEIAAEAVEYFKKNVPFGESHITNCYIRLYEYLSEAGADFIGLSELKSLLITQVNYNICRDTAKWETEYVARPCDFFNSRESIFYPDNRDAAEYQCEFFVKAQQPDGGYPVTWKWWTDYKEFEIAAMWWRATFAVTNMLYLRNFRKI